MMSADIDTYYARIGGSVIENELENGVLKKRQVSFSAKVCFVGLVIVTLLVIGGVGLQSSR
jgi:hypothetical protein